MRIQIMNKLPLLFLLLVISACYNTKSKRTSAEGQDSLSYHVKHIQVPSADSVFELNSYNITDFMNVDTIKGMIAYNYRLHSLDIINLDGKHPVSSIPLQQEGPDGVSNRISGIDFINWDSIWIYDKTAVCLLNKRGEVKNRISMPGSWEKILVEANYAINTAKFTYNQNHHSLLYLAKRDSFVIEEFDVINQKVVKRYPLSNSVVNLERALLYGDMDAPNVTFVTGKVIYNYPYESNIYLLDLNSGKQSVIDAKSRYTSNEARQCTAKGYSLWERHRIENVHFYDVMYLSGCDRYVRLHLSGKEFDANESAQALIDGKDIYMMCFDKDFNLLGESKLENNKYCYYTGWCALPDALLMFNDNSLSDSVDENLNMDLIYPCDI